ncbi:MAG: hypothetical protein IKX20_06665 [Paludibacteraceae bacterium]|nr:hypothetical protein [Paludibacteraceae bacterium]
MSIFSSKGMAPDLDVVKNVIIWSLHPGEIARRIDVKEFESLSNAKGVYVQDGVIAVLMVNGIIKTKLSSGVYYFESKIETFGDALRHVWRFFTGRKREGSGSTSATDSGRLGSELQNLGKGSLIDVILVQEAIIPVVFGGMPVDGHFAFKPYTIPAANTDLVIGVSLQLQIDDIVVFSRNNLTKINTDTDNHSCRIVDIQIKLKDAIENVLKTELAYENVESTVLSPSLTARLKTAIINKSNSVLFGISVKQVIDITMQNEDFERFRSLERKISISKKELDYLIRTNDFKNRLTAEQNSQVVREARSEEELRYALQQLNKDKLLHDDEMEAFSQLLASQKILREAKSEEELNAALQEIEKSKLIRDDDFEDLKQEIKKHGLARQEEFDILEYQSLRRTERERISVMSDIRVMLAKAEKEGEQAEYETAKQEQEHKHDIQESEAEHDIRMAGLDVESERVYDKFDDEKERREHQRGVDFKRDDINLEDEEERKALERAKIAQDIGLAGLSAIREEDRKDKAQDNAHEIEITKLGIEKERIVAERFRGMSAEQIAAINLDKLSAEAQKAFADALSSQREIDWLKISAEERVKIYKELAERSSAMEKESREQQERTLDKMMSFAAEAMKTNASLVSSAVAGQKAQAEQILSTVKDVATHRIEEVESDKKEAKEGERYAQSRMDHAQDTALDYTTRVTQAEIAGEAFKEASGPISYLIVSMGITVSLADILGLINAGTITPDTELSVNGAIFKASERPELAPSIDQKYKVECHNCGAYGYRGHTCPECGTLL